MAPGAIEEPMLEPMKPLAEELGFTMDEAEFAEHRAADPTGRRGARARSPAPFRCCRTPRRSTRRTIPHARCPAATSTGCPSGSCWSAGTTSRRSTGGEQAVDWRTRTIRGGTRARLDLECDGCRPAAGAVRASGAPGAKQDAEEQGPEGPWHPGREAKELGRAGGPEAVDEATGVLCCEHEPVAARKSPDRSDPQPVEGVREAFCRLAHPPTR